MVISLNTGGVFLNDPLVKGRASEKDVELLVKDMIQGTAGYLPEKWNLS